MVGHTGHGWSKKEHGRLTEEFGAANGVEFGEALARPVFHTVCYEHLVQLGLIRGFIPPLGLSFLFLFDPNPRMDLE
jgi:hypothetical protein